MQFVHIPRTGGTSLLEVFKAWYPGLVTTYERKKYKGKFLYGHFYQEGYDSIIFLREPFDQHLSYYNYTRIFTSMPDVNTFFRETASTQLKFLPERIKFIGIYERFEDDVKRLAEFLGKEYIKPELVNTCNVVDIPDEESIEIFKEKNRMIYDLYEKSLIYN